jgi:hypothetical protein
MAELKGRSQRASRPIRRLLTALVLAAATQVPARSTALDQAPAATPPVEDEQILVTGSRDAARAVADFVGQVTIETANQIAKFATPICAASFGLPSGYNEVITARVRQVAEYVGIGTAGDGCRPNIVVVVADSGGDFVERLHGERPDLFRMMELGDIRRVLRLAGPSRAWQVIEQRGADGRPMNWIEVGRERRLRPSLDGVMPSLTQQPTRQDLSLSFVVFDLEAIEGLTLLQIADHAAMRALARTDIAGLPARRSILTLFTDRASGATPAGELTGWDIAYLAALYRTGNTVSAHQQRSSIARTMRRELQPDAPQASDP